MSERSVQLAERRVRVSRVADVVADRIRDLIVSGELDDGDRLPHLDVLVEDFGVSAPSMREALRILESEGLITVQRGNIGGALVHRPDASTAAYIVALVLRVDGTKLRDVFEAMSLLDPVCAALCARRPDRKETVVSELQKCNDTARNLIDGDYMAFNEAMMRFHETVVQQCGNQTLTLVAGILESIWSVNERVWAESVSSGGQEVSRRMKLKTLEAHEEIARLIELGKDRDAAQAWTDHLHGAPELIYRTVDPNELVDPLAIRENR